MENYLRVYPNSTMVEYYSQLDGIAGLENKSSTDDDIVMTIRKLQEDVSTLRSENRTLKTELTIVISNPKTTPRSTVARVVQ